MLQKDLIKVSRQCEVLHDLIIGYHVSVSTLPSSLVKMSLEDLKSKVMAVAASLNEAHGKTGVIFISMNESRLFIRWEQQELSSQAKQLLTTQKIKILSLEVFYQTIDELETQLRAGQLVEAVKFINCYRDYVEWDYAKISQQRRSEKMPI